MLFFAFLSVLSGEKKRKRNFTAKGAKEREGKNDYSLSVVILSFLSVP